MLLLLIQVVLLVAWAFYPAMSLWLVFSPLILFASFYFFVGAALVLGAVALIVTGGGRR